MKKSVATSGPGKKATRTGARAPLPSPARKTNSRRAGKSLPRNRCTCPAHVDITFTGHLPDCATWDRPKPKRKATTTDRRLKQVLTSPPTLVIGPIMMMKLAGDRVWLGNVIGEGMECSEEKLGKYLERFFTKHF